MLTMLILFAVLGMAAFVFEFPKVLDTTDDVPDKYKGLYTKGADGKFALDDELNQKTDNSKLTSALDKERKKAKELEKREAGWKGLGLGDSPDDAAAKLAEEVEDDTDDDLAKKKGVDKKLMQKLKAENAAEVARTKQEYEGKLTNVQKVLKAQMIDGAAAVAVAELKGVAGLLLPHIRDKCLLVEEDGVYQVRVVDEEGDPRGNGKGGWMTIKDLVAEMRQSEVYGRAFEADQKQGSGKPPGGGGNGGSGDRNQKLNATQRIAKGLNDRNRR